jgi:adenylate cyclase
MSIDFEAEGLLEGVEGGAREARRELLEELADDGVELDELRAATEEGRLALIPVDRALGGGGGESYSSEDIAAEAGLEREFLDRLWRGLGMAIPDPGEPVFTDADLEAARRARAFRDAGMSEEGILEISRTISRAMANVAASIGAVFTGTFQRPGDDEQTLAVRYAEASRELLPMLGPVLEHILNVQQRNLIRQAAADTGALAEGRLPGALEMTFCFADLVGFTHLGESVAADELGAVAQRLEELAIEHAEPPVRLIKMIGDAVMLGSTDTDALLDAALKLVAAADEQGEDFPQLKAGVAHGEALSRAGDWFGRPVNLAARITDIARPGSVLAEEVAKDAAQGDFRWSSARARKIKGVKGEVELFRVRPPGPDDGD